MANSSPSLNGNWQGNPSNGGIVTAVFTFTQNGTAVTGGGTGWLLAYREHYQTGWTLNGEILNKQFTLQSSSSPALTFTGTMNDANNISGELVGELNPGSKEKAQISCVLLDSTYQNSLTGRWAGTIDLIQSVTLSIVQTGTAISGVGTVNLVAAGQIFNFGVFVSGSVTYPNFSLELRSPYFTHSQIIFHLAGKALDSRTIKGVIAENLATITLKKQ